MHESLYTEEEYRAYFEMALEICRDLNGALHQDLDAAVTHANRVEDSTISPTQDEKPLFEKWVQLENLVASLSHHLALMASIP